eukprot:CAMPEP_0179207672 /NCGR_PEP_ID=MMETSP0796-20121207/103561_1 /TAXON_ID=73915 /ORGANISM="Pyrodinium bahamense, Strain pbaha01" /LENGTH=483 /DNA_ID=CAMNT_0020912611 /DNA_START=54 /DNA_END=1505 /DNA_ORIENTATION=+
MSWDGGATQQSTHSLEVNHWTAGEQGVVIGIDRFPGVVITACFWGYVMGRYDAKKFLLLAVFAKAVSCWCFGFFDPSWKIALMAARFFMGVWESLFSVWVYGWIGFHAGHDRMVDWNNYLGPAAGAGNAAGGLLASLTTPDFGVAYRVQAALLGVAFAVVLLLPAESLRLRDPRSASRPLIERKYSVPEPDDDDRILRPSLCGGKQLEAYVLSFRSNDTDDAVAPVAHGGDKNFCEQVEEVLSSAMFRNTCVAWSLCAFIQTGFTCLWQNTAVDVWGFEVWEASVMFGIINAVAVTLGMTRGADWIEKSIRKKTVRYAELSPKSHTLECLSVLVTVTFWTAVLSTLASTLLALKTQTLVEWNIPQPGWGGILVSMILAIGMFLVSVTAVQGFMIKECRGHEREAVRQTGDGIRVVGQNAIGYGLGAFLPGMVTTCFGAVIRGIWDGIDPEAVLAAQYTFGMSFVFLSSWALFFFTHRAKLAAQ